MDSQYNNCRGRHVSRSFCPSFQDIYAFENVGVRKCLDQEMMTAGGLSGLEENCPPGMVARWVVEIGFALDECKICRWVVELKSFRKKDISLELIKSNFTCASVIFFQLDGGWVTLDIIFLQISAPNFGKTMEWQKHHGSEWKIHYDSPQFLWSEDRHVFVGHLGEATFYQRATKFRILWRSEVFLGGSSQDLDTWLGSPPFSKP